MPNVLAGVNISRRQNKQNKMIGVDNTKDIAPISLGSVTFQKGLIIILWYNWLKRSDYE